MISSRLAISITLIMAMLSSKANAQEEKSAADIVDSLFMRASSGMVMFRDEVEPSKQALIAMGAEAIPQMLTKLNTRSAREMHTIVAIFEGIGENAVEPLAKKLKARDDYVRRLAIRCLADIKSPKAIEPLAAIANHDDFRTRAGIMRALGLIGHKSGAEFVLKGLSDDDELVATSAAVACGLIKENINPLALVDALSHPYFGVRYSAMKSLVDLGESSVGPLIQHIETHPRDISTGYAIEALGEIGSKDALDVFKQTIKSDDWTLRAFSAEALGDLNQKKARKVLKQALKAETHPLVIQKIKNSLAVYEEKS